MLGKLRIVTRRDRAFCRGQKQIFFFKNLKYEENQEIDLIESTLDSDSNEKPHIAWISTKNIFTKYLISIGNVHYLNFYNQPINHNLQLIKENVRLRVSS